MDRFWPNGIYSYVSTLSFVTVSIRHLDKWNISQARKCDPRYSSIKRACKVP